MTHQTVTAIIPAKNEEHNIERCIKSLQWCDKVQVLWMGDDETGSIAKRLGAEVIEMNKSATDDFTAVQKNINWAIEHCTTDWILRIDADEEVTSELKNEISSLVISNAVRDPQKSSPRQIVAYGIPRNQFFWGGFLKGGDWAFDRLVRLFKPQHAKYDPIVPVHEQLKIDGPIGYLSSALNHYSHPTLDIAIKKFNIYTSMEAEHKTESYKAALFKMIFVPNYIFLRWMIWHRGYRDGIRGVVAGIMRAWYDFIVYAKYIEKKYKKLQ